jgi:hypothetical protein
MVPSSLVLALSRSSRNGLKRKRQLNKNKTGGYSWQNKYLKLDQEKIAS